MRVAPIASVRSVTVPSVSNQESPMDTQDLLQHLSERARFSGTKMTKLDCFRSDRLLIGLNCFEPEQEQQVHTHAGADKFYLVVTGKARFILGESVREAGPGDLILAPAGGPHGVERGRAHVWNSSHGYISYAVFCLKKKKKYATTDMPQELPGS